MPLQDKTTLENVVRPKSEVRLGPTPGTSKAVAQDMPQTGHDDLEIARLVQAAASGDRGAQADVVSRLIDRVRRTVRYLVANDRDADDLVQQCLIDVLRSLHSFRGEGKLEAWAERITVRTAMRAMRKRRWRERIVSLGLEGADCKAGEINNDFELRRYLAKLLADLAPERRVVVVLRLVQGYSIAEISAVTGAPINTVRDRLAKGKKVLAKRIVKDPVLRAWARRTGI